MPNNSRNDERKKSVSSQYPSPVKDSCESETQGFSSSRQKICPKVAEKGSIIKDCSNCLFHNKPVWRAAKCHPCFKYKNWERVLL